VVSYTAAGKAHFVEDALVNDDENLLTVLAVRANVSFKGDQANFYPSSIKAFETSNYPSLTNLQENDLIQDIPYTSYIGPASRRYASEWKRLFASFIDGLVLGVIGLLFGTWIGLVEGTVGERMLGLRVINVDGQRISYGKAVVHALG
jgi:hypothetical protein